MLLYLKNCFAFTLKEKEIHSLDGLRAVSVLSVIIGHFFLQNTSPSFNKFFIYQDIGVSLFFVISGFLITNLLFREIEKTGTISLTHFFINRFFRIFPAYYFFLLVTMALFPRFGEIIPTENILGGFLYLGFYYPKIVFSPWAHIWSLAIEEQFYLIWPPIVKTLKNKTSLKNFILFLIFITIFSRIGTYFLWDNYKNKIHFLLHTRIDSLMFGCLLAYLHSYLPQNKIFDFFTKKQFLPFALTYLLIIYPFLYHLLAAKFRATIGYTIEGFLLMGIIVNITKESRAACEDKSYLKILNSKIFIHLGSISYGIYLWQQPFIYIENANFLFHFPVNLIIIYIMALISFILIEYPAITLRKRLLAK